MNRVLPMIAMTGTIFAGEHVFAVDSTSQPTMSKRHMVVQIVDCMKKRMSADKTISYNAAAKACKDQISKQTDNSPSGTLVASDTPTKP
jgi:hypothetical protein